MSAHSPAKARQPPAHAYLGEPASVIISHRDFLSETATTGDIEWPDFVDWLASLATTRAPSKKSLLLWSAAELDGAGIRLPNVLAVHAAVLDFDGISPAAWDAAVSSAKAARGLCYATYSNHTVEKPGSCGRIILPLDVPCPVADWPRAHAALLTLFPDADPACKDPVRMYFVPGINPEAPTPLHFEHWDGPLLPLEQLLALSPAHIPVTRPALKGELVATEDIVRLGRSLQRRQSEHEQRVGRAIVRALKGEAFAARGYRDQTAFALAGALAEGFPHADPYALAEHFALALDAQGAPTLEHFEGQISRLQAKREELQALKAGVQWLRNAEPAPEDQPPAPSEDLETLPPIVQYQGLYYLRDLTSAHYAHCYGKHDAHLAICQAYQNKLEVTNKNGARPLPAILQDYSVPLRGITTDHTRPYNNLDPHTKTLVLGTANPAIAPAYHEHIARWLKALAGEHEPALLQWISALGALDRAAPALYLWGEKNLGKDLLCTGLAQLWRHALPADIGNILGSFNSELLSTPLIRAEEGLPEDLSFATFRRMLTQTSRMVNEKFKPPVKVDGHIRLVITANNSDMFAFTKAGVVTADDAEAIASRLLVIHVKQAARAHVDVDTTLWPKQIAEHALWLRANVALQAPGERWAVAGGQLEAQAMAVQIGAHRFMPFVQLLASYLESPATWENTYGRAHAGDWSMRTHKGELLVSPDACKFLDKMSGVDFVRATNLLRMHEVRRRLGVPGKPSRPRYVAIDVAKIKMLTELDPAVSGVTLLESTETRLGVTSVERVN